MATRTTKTENEKKMSKRGQFQTNGKWIRKTTRLAIYLRDEFTCLYCSADLHGADPRDITLDHVIPKADGGTNRPDNLITACISCNCKKKDKPVEVFTSKERVRWIKRNIARNMAPYRTLARAIVFGDQSWGDEVGCD